MKRDMDLIRTILLQAEADTFAYGQTVIIEGVDARTCGQHVALMIEAGLVEGRVMKNDAIGIFGASIERLTNTGHDFCDGIRQDTIWNKAKEHVLKPAASHGLSVLVEYVKVLVRQQVFGAPPGS